MVYSNYIWKRIVGNIFDSILKIILKPLSYFNHKKNTVDDLRQLQPRKILIIRSDNIGDVVMATPFFHALKEKFPQSHLSVMVKEISKEILIGNPYVDEIICHDIIWNRERLPFLKEMKRLLSYDNISYPIRLYKIIKYLRKQKFDLTIELRGDIRNILFFTYLIGSKYRISFNKTGGEYLLTYSVIYPLSMHEIDINFKLVECFGVRKDGKRMEIYNDQASKERVDKLLQDAGVKNNDLLIIIHPGAKKIQSWAPERFAELSDSLIEKYKAKLLLTGAKSDKALVETIARLMKRSPVVLVGKTSIREFTALLNNSGLLICNDTGILHIASALGVKTIALFGPTSSSIFSHSNIVSLQKRRPCTPMTHEKCKRHSKRHGACMDEIEVKDVMDKVYFTLQN